jgi:tRNA(Ile)-lysidine synthetase-like protein
VGRRAGPPDQQHSAWEIALDAERVREPLVVRRRRAGDRIRLPAGGRRLQDVFVDAKVPRALRPAWPLIATPTEVVWIPGLRAAADYVATAASAQVIHLRVYQ